MQKKTFFGNTQSGEPVYRYTLTNINGMQADIMTLGCTLTSLIVPAKNGPVDVCLGYDTPSEYEQHRTFFGAICGRFANRIAEGKFKLHGKSYQLAVNDGPNHLHGGPNGFAFRVWDVAEADTQHVTFTRVSSDGEEYYPGNLRVSVTYTLDDDNTLSIRYDAISDADTILNLTNHAYWNLNGHDSGSVEHHTLTLPASYYCPTDSHALVTGELSDVTDTPFDFRTKQMIGSRIDTADVQLSYGLGYDHCYLLDGEEPVRLVGDRTGIELAVSTDLPAIQLYTANQLAAHKGKNGAVYGPRAAVCLETEQVPDAPNKPQFPSAVLKADEAFVSVTKHHFTF